MQLDLNINKTADMLPMLRDEHDEHSKRIDTVVANLIQLMNEPLLAGTNIIPWSCPVPSFGDASTSLVATLGINPSNREFVDAYGVEISGALRRFHTLCSLRIRCWSEAGPVHFRMISEACRQYFWVNPYDSWFKRLDRIISGTGTSYYSNTNTACHLDLVPYATACKWTELTPLQRATLLGGTSDSLGVLLSESPVRVLVLNGISVVDKFELISDVQFDKKVVPAWSLPRRSGDHVRGIAYEGKASTVAGVRLGREILVLGFNHNIQSSFGVTTEVMNSIATWISRSVRGVLR